MVSRPWAIQKPVFAGCLHQRTSISWIGRRMCLFHGAKSSPRLKWRFLVTSPSSQATGAPNPICRAIVQKWPIIQDLVSVKCRMLHAFVHFLTLGQPFSFIDATDNRSRKRQKSPPIAPGKARSPSRSSFLWRQNTESFSKRAAPPRNHPLFSQLAPPRPTCPDHPRIRTSRWYFS